MSAELAESRGRRIEFIPLDQKDRVLSLPTTLEAALEPYFLRPCTQAVEQYKLQRDERKLHGEYQRGIILPLSEDQERLGWIYNPSNEEPHRQPINSLDVYNATKPFRIGDTTVFAARVQPAVGMNLDSKVLFFEQRSNSWVPLEHPVLNLEDPFITNVDDQIVFGGVHVTNTSAGIKWQTVFYKGTGIDDLTEFTRSPFGMKDVRLVQQTNGSIGVFTRPRGEKGGLGQIGFTTIASLDQLTPQVMASTPLIAQRFPEDEWGGVNEAHTLVDGKIKVLGHRAYMDEGGGKHYYPWLFIYDPKTGASTDLGIIAASDDSPETESRAEELKDVYFPGGLDLESGTLYGGVRDKAQAAIPIIT